MFSSPMVRAILQGRKTQTRRACKLDVRHGMPDGELTSLLKCCPYGQPGDRLWVRESGWERPERTAKMMHEGADTWEPYYYDADGYMKKDGEQFTSWGFKRRPSIHMPRWASRITLEITGVRVERLHDISEEDAVAEGVPRYSGALFEFCQIWKALNGPGSWNANPWVWAIEFKRLS